MLKKVLLVCGGVLAAVVVAVGVWIGTAHNVRQLRDAGMLAPNGKTERTRTEGALDYSVATQIAAPAETVWSVLTDAARYPDWNSTLVKLEGTIARGSDLKLVAKVAPTRTFGLKVSAFEPNTRMEWEEGGKVFLGVRTFTLTPTKTGSVFTMQETFSGAMLGMIEGSLPDFTADFDGFAADLKKAAEGRASPHP